ncbi:hypothetical protein [Alysiella crassa]|uniref:Phage-type endonuclease n=1 Tax=Alysiella crassa TaxID=153491 RepID=A0A376BVV6_9NEIS|nr:hypothetical protein [Alysiella crassa]UOP06547.1 translocation protein TolB precursor [Alysiella crassa]SSY81080.1 Uncharacterised protein [Alysiella crassa]
MTIPNLEIRCSSLHKIMGKPKSKDELLGDTAKSHLFDFLKQSRFGYVKEVDSKEIRKGKECENEAIQNSGLVRGCVYEKCTLPRQHKVICEMDGVQAILTGECDIFDEVHSLIIDTKCVWDMSTFPICQMDAAQKAKKAGYDWQMHGYMMLYETQSACVDYWLLPTPEYFFSDWQRENEPDVIEQQTTFIEQIPWYERVTHLPIERNESKLGEIVARMRDALQFWILLHKTQFQAA